MNRIPLIAFALFACIAPLASANPYKTSAVFTVTSTASSRSTPGTLNWAVFQANYYGADVNYIRFNIPKLSPQQEIVLSEQLYIARLMILDATSQPGYAGQPLIHVNANGFDSAFLLSGNVANIPPYSDGSTATSGGNPGVHGVSAATAGTTLQGFHIYNYSSNAITILKESQGNFIQNNWMGFQQQGSNYVRNAAAHPGSRGMGIQSSFNTVRGNTISGVSNGIVIGEAIETAWSGTNYYTNAFENNNIGTDPSGSVVIGNDSDGMFLGAGASENFIGPANVFSGMTSSGVELLHPSNYGNIIIANMIGVNRAGTAALGNGELGVLIANGGDYNDIGGPSGGNIISGNKLGGIAIGTKEFPQPCTRIYVESNLVGTDVTGLKTIGSQISGITSQTGSETIINRNVIGGHSNHGIVLAEVGKTTATRNGQTVKLSNGLFGNWIGISASDKSAPYNVAPGRPGVQLLDAPSSTNGVPLPNSGFGVYARDAFNNYIQITSDSQNFSARYIRNVFGANQLNTAGFDGCQATDNVYNP
ncbi:MAG: hypothetical protein M3Z64_06615 [Verrucomicrobiota bacterium]|nr:hypothetical protein [Verrucomicrobiota bacterium]